MFGVIWLGRDLSHTYLIVHSLTMMRRGSWSTGKDQTEVVHICLKSRMLYCRTAVCNDEQLRGAS